MKTPNAPGAPRGSGGGLYGKGVSKSGAAAKGIGTGNPNKYTGQGTKVKTPIRVTKDMSTKTLLAKASQVDKELRKNSGVSGPEAGGYKGGLPLRRNNDWYAKKSSAKTRNSVALVNKAAMKKTPIKPSKPKVQKKTGRK
jgi:hypothetical protein